MKKIFPFITILFFGCFTKEKKHFSKPNNNESTYPKVIDSSELRVNYDIARWYLYCIYCDDTVKIRKSLIKTEKTFGSLDLKFGILEKRGDSNIIYFMFYYNNEPCTREYIDYKNDKPYTNGVVFIKDSLVSFTSSGTYFFMDNYEKSRYKKPLQPEVITYIKNNKNKLNPWFREQAKRRNVID